MAILAKRVIREEVLMILHQQQGRVLQFLKCVGIHMVKGLKKARIQLHSKSLA